MTNTTTTTAKNSNQILPNHAKKFSLSILGNLPSENASNKKLIHKEPKTSRNSISINYSSATSNFLNNKKLSSK